MKRLIILPLAAAGLSVPAQAEVRSLTEQGFNVYHVAQVDASPAVVWKRLVTPKEWWNPDHSWSGSTAGFYMDAKAGGCFCELIQEKSAAGKVVTIGSVEHMRIIYYHPEKVLRMQGGLGPLQSEAVLGTLTVAMEPINEGKATKLSFSYTVGGYMRQKLTSLSGAVDAVLGEQFKRLVEPFAAASAAAAASAPEKDWSLDVDGITGDGSDLVQPEVEGAESAPQGPAKPKAAAPKAPVADKKDRPVPANPEESR